MKRTCLHIPSFKLNHLKNSSLLLEFITVQFNYHLTLFNFSNDKSNVVDFGENNKVDEFYYKNHIQLDLKFNENSIVGNEKNSKIESLSDSLLFSNYKPKDFTDKFALRFMKFLRIFVQAFFTNRFMHHALVLETVAAVPGMVGGAWRHFVSLRKLTSKDHFLIPELLEEAENERMHLFTWLEVSKPTFFERILVILAQASFTTFYLFAYILNPRFCHRFVGYLEEESIRSYTEFLEAVERNEFRSVKVPDVAKRYWKLGPESTLRDLVIAIRNDECKHRDFNHKIADWYKEGKLRE
ncbi:hypothetical protein ABK040_015120 [Willaertia magna]